MAMIEDGGDDTETDVPASSGLSLDRLLLFTDGVYAIAITILVLDLAVPEGLSDTELYHELSGLLPELGAAALSFAVIGRFWLSHHQIFVWIRRLDLPLLWLNLASLAPIVFLPFTTRLLADYARVPLVVILYSATVAAVALTHLVIWAYATKDQRLTARVPEPVRVGKIAGLAMVAIAFLVAIPLAPVLGSNALFCYLLTAFPADRIVLAARSRPRSRR